MAIILGHDLKPHCKGTPKSEVLQLGSMRFTMWHEDVDVNLVYQFNGILAVRVVFVINRFKQRIAHPIQILLREEGVPAKYRLGDFLICIVLYTHKKIGMISVKNNALYRRDMDCEVKYWEYE